MGGVLHQGLRRGDDGVPGRHRVGHLGPGGPQDLRGAVRHQRRRRSDPRRRADPGHDAADRAARPSPRTARSCRPRRRSGAPDEPGQPPAAPARSAPSPAWPGCRGWTGPCCCATVALLVLGQRAGVVGDRRARRPDRRRHPGLPPTPPGQHRHRRRAGGAGRRDRPPLGPHPRAVGLRRQPGRAGAGAGDGLDHQRLAVLDRRGRHVDPAGGVRQARGRGRHGAGGGRADRGLWRQREVGTSTCSAMLVGRRAAGAADPAAARPGHHAGARRPPCSG